MDIQLKPMAGDSLWVLGDLYTFKLTGKQTLGTVTVIEQIIQPENGPPPHIHHKEDESFYILDGRFSFLCGDRSADFDTGSFIYIPRGTLHSFKNIGETQGKLLVTITPAGLEEFFYSIGAPFTGMDSAPGFDPGIIDKIMKLAPMYQMEVRLPG